MLPVKAIRLAIGTDMAANTTYWSMGGGSEFKLQLVTNAFTPDETLTKSSFTFATFTGSTPIAGTSGDQGVGTDPLTAEQVMTLLAPAGGWRWVCTVAPGAPETITGFIVLDNAGAVLQAMQLLDAPIVIANVGDEVDLGAITIRFAARPMS
jgi:hypothetical protein